MPTTSSSDSSNDANERDRIFARLSREDEEFRRKIVDLHRKLSDVDEDSKLNLAACSSPSKISKDTTEKLKGELRDVVRRAEEASGSDGTDIERSSVLRSPDESVSALIESTDEDGRRRRRRLEARRYSRYTQEHVRSRQESLRFFGRSKKSLEEDEAEERSSKSFGSASATASSEESNFLKRLRIKRRGIEFLSFLSGKAAERSQEERAARLLRMYMPEKGSRGQNTISVRRTSSLSRDRRFWKLRNRRRSSST